MLESLEMNKNIYQGNNINTADSLSSLGYLYESQGQYDNAFKYLLESLEMK